ncbi:hypothetical protein ONE63_009150 [Megalurothrips usitatus]|uniref:Receptor ligand binding region domain-containing protein n=1 Tax=Megalurothrips usitatus TaxID=439358 RepID=A0AAV7XK70_9NEOP|nr:hypothetical protein ONE63_009150 [Megalurothrips usitatus]
MLAAEELNMVDSGEYVFFNIELFSSMDRNRFKPWHSDNDTDAKNERARKAYQALLTVTARTPDNEAYRDRIADYSLLDMDPATGEFKIVANYIGGKHKLEYVGGREIHWSGGRTSPPADTPLCGFDGSLCPDNALPGYAILSMVLSSVVVVLAVASFFIYRYVGRRLAIA